MERRPLGPLEKELRLISVRAALRYFGLGKKDSGSRLVQIDSLAPVVELHQYVSFLDGRVEIDRLARPVAVGPEVLDRAADFGHDFDDLDRLHRARGGDADHQVAARDGQGPELRPVIARIAPAVIPVPSAQANQGHQQEFRKEREKGD